MTSTPVPPSRRLPHRPATLAPGLLSRLLAPALAVLMVAHGAIHLMGVALLWKLDEPGTLRYADAVPTPGTAAAGAVGALWLLAALLFAVAAVLLLRRHALWRGAAVAGAILSIAVLALTPSMSAAGLVTDGVVLAAVGVSLIVRRSRTEA